MDELNVLNFEIQEKMMQMVLKAIKKIDIVTKNRMFLDEEGENILNTQMAIVMFFIDILYRDGKTKSPLL